MRPLSFLGSVRGVICMRFFFFRSIQLVPSCTMVNTRFPFGLLCVFVAAGLDMG